MGVWWQVRGYNALTQSPKEWAAEPGVPCSGERLLLAFDRWWGFLPYCTSHAHTCAHLLLACWWDGAPHQVEMGESCWVLPGYGRA